MAHGEELIVLGALFVLAYILGRLGKLIGLPAIPIYMLVGLLASPHSGWFPFSVESSHIELMAVIGLIMLLFSLGLEFDQDEFFGNAGKLLISGGSYIALNMAVGIGFGFALGWGSQEALIIAGITATSSSAIVTKLLIELKRLTNSETPMILGITVVEDVFIAIYLAIVGVVLSGETEPWPVILKLIIAFTFIVVMFALARFGGRLVSKLLRTRDDELFTILFFGLAVMFGGVGEQLGVTDAIGAFLIGLVIGASRYRNRVEAVAVPLRDIFGAFFFLNFGLGLDVATFGTVLVPVLLAVLMTVALNVIAGQFVAWLNGFDARAGINTTVILQNRGEFALILATIAASAGLDERIQPFAGLYVLIMAIAGPIIASQSERISSLILRTPARTATGSIRTVSAAEAAMAAEFAQTGSVPTVGPSTGGVSTGGVPTGAVSTGGVPTGGVPTGAVSTGGGPTGGVPTSAEPTVPADADADDALDSTRVKPVRTETGSVMSDRPRSPRDPSGSSDPSGASDLRGSRGPTGLSGHSDPGGTDSAPGAGDAQSTPGPSGTPGSDKQQIDDAVERAMRDAFDDESGR
ncbi:MAG: cation:proton antiporter domain-containing protein [Mycetocola sp.]